MTARGNRREALFYDERDRQGFLRLVAELPERFGLEVHAFVLMDSHYHLRVRTPEANLSQTMQWLNVSYGTRLNWAHRPQARAGRMEWPALVQQAEKILGRRWTPILEGRRDWGTRQKSNEKRRLCQLFGPDPVARARGDSTPIPIRWISVNGSPGHWWDGGETGRVSGWPELKRRA